MYRSTPSGITPPTPGLDREEPEFNREDDIPADDGGSAGSERERSAPGEQQGERRERGKLERE
jgi:hypothetical protein